MKWLPHSNVVFVFLAFRHGHDSLRQIMVHYFCHLYDASALVCEVENRGLRIENSVFCCFKNMFFPDAPWLGFLFNYIFPRQMIKTDPPTLACPPRLPPMYVGGREVLMKICLGSLLFSTFRHLLWADVFILHICFPIRTYQPTNHQSELSLWFPSDWHCEKHLGKSEQKMSGFLPQ